MHKPITGVEPSSIPALLRKAQIADVPAIQRLVNEQADVGLMLARSLSELYENIRDFWVAEDSGAVVACCALHVNWADLAEVRSLAVDKRHRQRGIGKAIVRVCLADARDMGIARVYALTREPVFFERCSFARIAMSELPRKVWGECIRCPKFPECDEVAMVTDV